MRFGARLGVLSIGQKKAQDAVKMPVKQSAFPLRALRRVLLHCVRTTPDSLFGYVTDLDSGKVAEKKQRIEKTRKASGFQSVADLLIEKWRKWGRWGN